MTSLLARKLFAVTLLCIRFVFFVLLAMRYNKTDRDCRYRTPLEIVSPQFGKYYPPLRVGQYFPNIGETISNSDLNTSHYMYTINRLLCSLWDCSNVDRNINERLLTTVTLVYCIYLHECAFYLSDINGRVKALSHVHYNIRLQDLRIQTRHKQTAYFLLYFARHNRPRCVPCISLYSAMWKLCCWVLKKEQYSPL